MAEEKHFDMAEEFAGLDFHSIRLEARFVRTMETLAKQPGASIWEASDNRAEAKAIYRILGNDEFDREAILERTGKQPYGVCQAMAVLFWRFRIPRESTTTPT